jgi:hypothetical protein
MTVRGALEHLLRGGKRNKMNHLPQHRIKQRRMHPARAMRHRNARGVVHEESSSEERNRLERDIPPEVPQERRVIVLQMWIFGF